MASRVNPTRSAELGVLGHLADSGACHDAIEIEGENTSRLITMLERMILIRAAEEHIAEMVSEGTVKCPCHLAIGQEAAAVGVAAHLRPTDRLFGAHRSHAHYLAIGAPLHKLFAEVLGRDTGASRGMGGSMHLFDRDHGLFGTVPIVAATIPIAVGAGLAARLDGDSDVAVAFFGDGATEEGVFHESMNLAVMLKAPVLFVCENNLFSSHLHISLRQPADSVSRYAAAHCIPYDVLDGNDVVAVSHAASRALDRIRTNPGPHFLELATYRWRGHVGPRDDEDVGVRRKHDLTAWKKRDPIGRLATALFAERGFKEQRLTTIWDKARLAVRRAWARAVADPHPPMDALLDRVYADRPQST